VEDLRGVATEVDLDGNERRASARVTAVAGRGDEEVQQDRLLAGRGDEHVATGAGTAQQRLGDPGGQHRRDGRVDGVGARRQHVGAGLRGQRVAGRDHPRGALLHGTRLVGRPHTTPRRRGAARRGPGVRTGAA
jgi:hypothetical protein